MARRTSKAQTLGVDPSRQLVLDEARRTIDQQVKDLDGLRSRASHLTTLAVGAGTFITGVLVNQGIQPGGCSWLGFAALGLAALLGLWALLPQTFEFTLDLESFDTRSFEDDPDTFARTAALSLAARGRSNQRILDRLFAGYLVGLTCLVIGAVVLVVTLTWR